MTLLDEIRLREQARGGRGNRQRQGSEMPSAAAKSTAEEALAQARLAPVGDGTGDVRLGYAIILTALLYIVHATLATLARAQYGQELSARLVMRESLSSVPVFFLLAYMLHPRLARSRAMQASGFIAATLIGCYLVYLVNREGFYASMYKAPPLGTLWVWLFIELEWYAGAASFAAVAAYTWINGYSFT